MGSKAKSKDFNLSSIIPQESYREVHGISRSEFQEMKDQARFDTILRAISNI